MKTYKLIGFFIVGLLMTSCSNNGSEEKYVKNILFTKIENEYNILFEYYDFSTNEENYLIIDTRGSDIEKLAISSVKNNKLNFRLCENVYISTEIIENETSMIFYIIKSLKIPVDTNVFCCLEDNIPDNLYDSIQTKLYNFSVTGGKVSGVMSLYDEAGKYSGGIILSRSKLVKYLPENQWKLLNVLTSNNHNFTLQFREGHMVAELENCNCYVDVRNRITLNISARLKEYNGVANSILQEDLFKDLLKTEIKNIVSALYNDTVTAKECNLYWFVNKQTIANDKMDIIVTIY